MKVAIGSVSHGVGDTNGVGCGWICWNVERVY